MPCGASVTAVQKRFAQATSALTLTVVRAGAAPAGGKKLEAPPPQEDAVVQEEA